MKVSESQPTKPIQSDHLALGAEESAFQGYSSGPDGHEKLRSAVRLANTR